MKATNLILALTVSSVMMFAVSASARTGDEKNKDKENKTSEDLYMEAEKFFNTFEVVVIVPEDPVKVYDQNENLVASGNEDDSRIQEYMKIADFLTEVNGVSLYRLSYENPVDQEIHLATR